LLLLRLLCWLTKAAKGGSGLCCLRGLPKQWFVSIVRGVSFSRISLFPLQMHHPYQKRQSRSWLADLRSDQMGFAAAVVAAVVVAVVVE
jgi:hypothetical protein